MTADRFVTAAVIALYGAAGGLLAYRYGEGAGVVVLIVAVVWTCWASDQAHVRIDRLEGRLAVLEQYEAAPDAETAVMPAWAPPRTSVARRYGYMGGHRR